MLIKNRIIFIIVLVFNCLIFNYAISAEELDISASEITIKNEEKLLIAEGSVVIIDSQGNIVTTEKAEYDKLNDKLITYQNTKITLKNGYQITSSEVLYDNKNQFIKSNQKTDLIDLDGNYITVDMFEYLLEKNLFSSSGNIQIIDTNKNKYFFNELYIDTKEKKIVGSDIRVSMDQESFGLTKENDPRFVANSALITEEKSTFSNGVFTTCKQRGEKCPPWTLQAKEISHDKAKKTIYYDHATLKIYDVPIFYFPKFFHPDPTVKRQSGFLIPFLTDTSSVGAGFALPYFWAIDDAKDLTFSPKYYSGHKALLLAEYRQAFENSFLHLDTSYTGGYKNISESKTSGSRNHIFAKYYINLNQDPSYNSRFSIDLKKVNNPTYFRIHGINTSLVNSETTNLMSEITYNYKKNDLRFNISSKVYENLDEQSNKRYEYFLPNIEFGKNIFTSERLGILNFESKAYYNNYDVNKTNKFLINDIFWDSKNFLNKKGFLNSFKAQIKNTNYDSKGDASLKQKNNNHEISGTIAFKSELPMQKETANYIKTL